MSPQQAGLQTNLDYFAKALASGPVGASEINEQFLQVALQVADSPQVPDESKQSFLSAAASSMQAHLADEPNDVRELLFYGSFLNQVGVSDKAVTYLEKAHQLSPGKQDVSFNLGASYIALKDYDKAFSVMQDAYNLEKDNPEAKTYYGTAAVYDGKTELLEGLFGTDVPLNTKIAQAYLAVKNYPKAIAIASAQIKADPTNPSNHLLLAGIYIQEGSKQAAIAELQSVIDMDPSYQSELQPIIDQLEGKTTSATQ